jgi:hypothetical protein
MRDAKGHQLTRAGKPLAASSRRRETVTFPG